MAVSCSLAVSVILLSLVLQLFTRGVISGEISSNGQKNTSKLVTQNGELEELDRGKRFSLFSSSSKESFHSFYMLDDKVIPYNDEDPEDYSSHLWPSNIIPYKLDISDESTTDLLLEAMKEWQDVSCIKFENVDKVSKTYHRKDYLAISFDETESSACKFDFGRREKIDQDIILHKKCMNKQDLLRGLGLVIGLPLEVLRDDRDEFVTLTLKDTLFTVPFSVDVKYDYLSIMHPGSMWQATEDAPTIMTQRPEHQGLIDGARGISHRDKKKVNKLYKCAGKNLKCALKSLLCQNEGFVNSDCKCVCREGTSGKTCGTISDSHVTYYSPYLPSCSKNITVNTKIVFPNDTSGQNDNWCVWNLKAPTGRFIKLNHRHVSIPDEDKCPSSYLMFLGSFYYVKCGHLEPNSQQEVLNQEASLYLNLNDSSAGELEIDVCFVKSYGDKCLLSSSSCRLQITQPLIRGMLILSLILSYLMYF